MPEWYIYRYNINSKKIEKYNVFHNIVFFEDCKKALEKYKEDELSEELFSIAAYTYWCRSEYEVMIGEIFDCTNAVKIDAYEQLTMNWNAFVNYVKEAYKCGLFSSTSMA